jgi:hypothetical protein
MRTSTRILLLALGGLALRAPLWLLPGAGRDEATYTYWSEHFELSYAPLLQLGLWMLRNLGAASPMAMRSLSLAAGILVLWLLNSWLTARGHSARSRALAIAVIALSPWQTYVGSFVHPDNLLVAAMLYFALSCHRAQFLRASVAALLALWAKPSGLLVVFVATWFLVQQLRSQRDRRSATALGLLVLGTGLSLSQWNWGMIEALRSFGRVPPGVGILSRGGLALGTLLFLAGPLPLLATTRGVRAAWPPRRGRAVGETLGLLYLTVFVVAAVLLGQIKANWILPAVLLLWPQLELRSTAWRGGALFAPAVVSVALVVAFVSPSTLRRVEARLEHTAPRYLTVAGEREATVASAQLWWHRTAEYQSLDRWTADLCEKYPSLLRCETIVSDDYGLAAQLAVELERVGPNSGPRLVLPFDPLFQDSAQQPVTTGALLLAVRHPVTSLDDGAGPTFEWPHPITGQPLKLAWIPRSPTNELSQRRKKP